MTKSDFPSPPEAARQLPASISALAVPAHEALVVEIFEAPDRDEKIAVRVRRAYEAAHPGACNAKIEAEAASERLAFLRAEQRRCVEHKQRCDLLSERHVGRRKVPLTRHIRLNYLLMASASVAGILVGTWALSEYAIESGVMTVLDNSFWAAFVMAFPEVAAAQALKAAGSALCKHDDAKRSYYGWLTKLGFGCAAIFVLAAAVAFAPHPTDLNAIRDTLTTGGSPQNAFAEVCKAVAPYLVVGAGLLTEVLAAAVIAHRADQMNELGRDVIQGISPTQLILDARINELQAEIEEQARKTATLQAAADRHEATITEQTEAAQAYARELAAEYALHKTRSRKDFLDKRSKKDD